MNEHDAHPRPCQKPIAGERSEPLPLQIPKAAEEDPEAPQRLKKILSSASYRQADQDVDFLNQDELRAFRLQVDFFKAEQTLQENQIRNTIVVFGGTRIKEPGEAKRKVDGLKAALESKPGDPVLLRKLGTAERIYAKSHYYNIAHEFGRLVGDSRRQAPERACVIMTGGGPGLMEAANRGAYDSGALTVGLNINLPYEQFPNPYITPELCFRFHYFAIRKLHFLLRAKALVVFPGGYGTFDELFETLTLMQTRKIKQAPVVLVGECFWKDAFNVDFLIDEGVIDPEDRDLFWYAETAEEIWQSILDWYNISGAPLI
ncbi:LOG family protein [Methylomicrobium sp. Wu6]|uniref:LOG family protein n=1 Tax=Methylomicrobium sp. Wu6 TaxID=3107928 RepID=UPI002DD6401D|nr:LOG family protein [Methylomicrobium sp. Wu6]MEC4749054.1 LOG family protein [Methylomicrobium sp. Wu6]